MQTWQIVLIICSAVLVFTVVIVAILSCWCKTRKRLDDNEATEDDLSFYQHNYHLPTKAAAAADAASTATTNKMDQDASNSPPSTGSLSPLSLAISGMDAGVYSASAALDAGVSSSARGTRSSIGSNHSGRSYLAQGSSASIDRGEVEL